MLDYANHLQKLKHWLNRKICFCKESSSPNSPNYKFHLDELSKVESRLDELRATGHGSSISEAVRAEQLKQGAKDAEMAAIGAAWAKQNPGKKSMPFGGEETQKLYDQFASAPPSAKNNVIDERTCSYCNKSSAEKMNVCSVCKKYPYCSRECQKLAWKGHKLICVPSTSSIKATAEERENLPLTWEQLEAFGGVPAQNKVLEVRVMNVINFTRQVIEAKDRVGAVRNIAAYTDSRSIPGVAAGKVVRWKNPRFHYFLDGSSGARVEDGDLSDITIGNA